MKRILLLTLLGLIFYTQNAKAQGQLWGNVVQSGEYDLGAIIKLNGDGTGFSTEKSIPIEANNPGYYPSGDFIKAQNGKIYGLTYQGGASNKGVLFELDPFTNSYLKKVEFSTSIGSYPSAGLTEANGKLYGATNEGGAYDKGTIYEFDPQTGAVEVKIDLNEYRYVSGAMTFANGKLVGWFSAGTNYSGGIFEVDIATFGLTIVANFSSLGLGTPSYGMSLANNGNFYGQIYVYSINAYGIIEYNPTNKVITKKVDLAPRNYPNGSLTLANSGKFYGTFFIGEGNGSTFLGEYDPNNSVFVKKIDFPADSNGSSGVVLGSNGNLYGLFSYTASSYGGIIYEINLSTNQFSEKYAFRNDGSGHSPTGRLAETADGSFLGVTTSGGSNSAGVIFRYSLSPSNYSKKYNFVAALSGNSIAGDLAYSPLTKKLYGMHRSGGQNNLGVLFEYDPNTEIYLKKIDFDNRSVARSDFGMTAGPNGKLYWLTNSVSVNYQGAIFEFDPSSGNVSKKYDFQGGLLGASPYGKLVLGSNNKFYGLTTFGGLNGRGVFFEYDPINGIFTKKNDFLSTDGYLTGALIQGSSGRIYGTTSPYGDNSILYEYDITSGVFRRRFQFASGGGFSSMVEVDNKLIGVGGGGLYAWGQLSEFDLATDQLTKVIDFSYTQSGGSPNGLSMSNNGKLYGVTQVGGTFGRGVIYEYDPKNKNYAKVVDLTKGYGPSPLTFVPTNLTPPEPQTIAFGTIPKKTYFDPPFNLASTSSAGLVIIYTSSNLNVAKVTGSEVTIMGIGSTTITATQPGNGYYSAATAVQQTLTVEKATQTITFNPIADKAPSTATVELIASSSSGLPITFTSSNSAVATIEGKIVTIKGQGTTIITASQAGNEFYSSAPNVEQPLTVAKLDQTITFYPLINKLKGDAPFSLVASSSSGLTVAFASSDPTIASVNGTTVTIIKEGSVSITASQAGSADYKVAASVSQSLTIETTFSAKGKLWGVTQYGGDGNSGVIYTTQSDGTGYKVVKSLVGDVDSKGTYPGNLMQASNGKFYGLTYNGGAYNLGVLFEFDPITETYVKKIDFSKEIGLVNPTGTLVQAGNGKLYGISDNLYGSSSSLIAGGIFEYDLATGAINKKVTNSDIQGNLLDNGNGKFYGYSNNIFEFDPATGLTRDVVQLPYDFSAKGSWRGLVKDNTGKFFGIAANGGNTSRGIIFEFYPTTGMATKRFEFLDESQGTIPLGGMSLASNGKFYGVTFTSALFEFDPITYSYSKKIDLGGGYQLSGVSLGSNGNIYGLANGGTGKIFEFNPITSTFLNLYSFSGTDGYSSGLFNTLFQATNGLLYGMTSGGGSLNTGVLFKFNLATNNFAKVVDFSTPSSNGIRFSGSLTRSSVTKKLYGIAEQGGIYNKGVLFEFDPLTNSYLKKIDFDGVTSTRYFGYGSQQQLTEASNGKFYWYGFKSPTDYRSAIYEFDPVTNSTSKRFEFPQNGDLGVDPVNHLTLASDGKLYGITSYGAKNNNGALFTFDPTSGNAEKKLDFKRAETGYGAGDLILGVNNRLYGAFYSGGANDKGTLFEYDAALSTYSKKVDFIENGNEFYLTQAISGKLYGLNRDGGVNQRGFLFEYDITANSYAKVIDFNYNTTGSAPTRLVQAGNGKLYGTSTNYQGQIFEFNPANNSISIKSAFDGNSYGGSNLLFIKDEQVIMFNSIAPKTFGDPTFNLSASSSSGLPISFKSSDPTIASIEGSQVTILKAGTITITASQAGDLSYFPAESVQTTLTVAKATPIVTWANPAEIVYGISLDSNQLNASSSTAGTFAYTPESGTKLNAGSNQLSVVFTPSDAANYATASKQVTITVTKALPIVTWSNPAEIVYGTSLSATQLNATSTTEGTFTYSPASGTKLNAGSNQSLSVTFTPTVAANYTTATKQVAITVSRATPAVTWSSPSEIVYGTSLSNIQLNATTPTEGIFSYAPASGTKLNAGSNQTLIVVFTPIDAANYTTTTKQVSITVAKATPVVTWNTPAEIVYGTSLSATQLNATSTSEGTFTYLPASGTKLNAGSNQSLSVTFTPTDAANYSAAIKQVSITVAKATPAITWNSPAEIVYGTSLNNSQLNAAPSTEGIFTYSPASGTKLNAGINQSLSVTFTPTDAANFNSATKQVTITVSKATPVLAWNNPTEVVYGTSLSATQLNATSTTDGAFAYSPASGTKLNAGSNQSLSVTFTPTDAANFNSATKQVTITVSKATPVITWNNPTEIVYGTSLGNSQFNATSTTEGTFTYSPAIGTKLNAGSNQSLSVTFTPADAANYSAATKQVSIAVAKATPAVTWNSPAEIVYGTSLSNSQLNAASSTEGIFTYSPASGTKLNAGINQSLSVTFTPTDAANFNSATKQVTITVSKATPVLAWNNPTEVVYGTSLSATQLNATSTTDGAFAYSPAIGTKLNAGINRSLSVTFTPTDAANFNSATKQVTITVSKATPVLAWNNPTEVVYGTSLSATQLNATSTTDGAFAYSPAIGTKLNAGSNQSVSVTFIPTDAANYTTATKQVNIAVGKATPAVAWNNPNEIVYGTSLSSTQLNATSTTEGIFSYSPASGTKLNAGSNQSLLVLFTPTDAANYTTASKQVTISVTKASQQLTFLQLPDKLFGSGVIELTATATSGLPVKFSFSSDKISINETQVTLLKAGRVKILASQSGNDNFLAAVSSEQSFCIKPIKPIIEAPIISGSGFILTSNSTTGNQWFLNDKLLPSATGQTLNATESGTYKLQVNADDCASEFSLDKALLVTGDLQDDLSKIEIYPNPVTDWLTIKLGEESIKKEVSIVDLTGRQMVQKEVYGSEAQVNVVDYSQGIYLLKVSSSTTTRIIKFEKQQ